MATKTTCPHRSGLLGFQPFLKRSYGYEVGILAPLKTPLKNKTTKAPKNPPKHPPPPPKKKPYGRTCKKGKPKEKD